MMIDCTGEAFSRLTNPYTGEPMRVKMLVTKGGSPRFFCPSTYSTHSRFGSAKAAYDAWAREEGIIGARVGKEIRCAYTGELLVPKHDETGHWFDGGFDPRRFWSRHEFLRFASMRDGKTPVAPEPEQRVSPAPPAPDRKPLGHEIAPGQEAMGIAEAVAEKAGIPHKTSVSVPRSVRRRNLRG